MQSSIDKNQWLGNKQSIPKVLQISSKSLFSNGHRKSVFESIKKKSVFTSLSSPPRKLELTLLEIEDESEDYLGGNAIIKVKLEFDEEEDLVLSLRRTPQLLASNFKVFQRYGNKTKNVMHHNYHRLQDCQFQGYIEEYKSSLVFLSGCGRKQLFGVLMTTMGDFTLRPLKKSEDENRKQHQQRDYTHTLERKAPTKIGDTERPLPRHLLNDRMHPGDNNTTILKRRKRGEGLNMIKQDEEVNEFSGRVKPEVKVIELAIFADQTMYEFVRGRFPDAETPDKLTEIVLAIFNGVQTILGHSSLGVPVRLVILSLEVLMDVDSGPKVNDGEIREYLDNFCLWQQGQNKGKDVDPQVWDHAILMSGRDLYLKDGHDETTSGMSYLGGMCWSQNSCTVSEGRSLGAAALIIAHELGHSLGIGHDGQGDNKDCPDSGFIMGARLSAGATTWSHCSRRELQHFLKLPTSRCLNDQPLARSLFEISPDNSLPGQKFDAETQCLYLYGPGWKAHNGLITKTSRADICSSIWCRQGFLLRTPNAAPLEGTDCGHNKICREGKCTALESKEQVQPSLESTHLTNRQLELEPQEVSMILPPVPLFHLVAPPPPPHEVTNHNGGFRLMTSSSFTPLCYSFGDFFQRYVPMMFHQVCHY